MHQKGYKTRKKPLQNFLFYSNKRDKMLKTAAEEQHFSLHFMDEHEIHSLRGYCPNFCRVIACTPQNKHSKVQHEKYLLQSLDQRI